VFSLFAKAMREVDARLLAVRDWLHPRAVYGPQVHAAVRHAERVLVHNDNPDLADALSTLGPV
jgi:hypothetical protein